MPLTRKDHPPIVSAVGWLSVIGAAIGVFAGLLLAGGLTASGVTRANLPPLPQAQTLATPTPLPTPSATPTVTSTVPQPTLTTDSATVAPGQRFALRGRIPGVPDGQDLQVQVKDGSGPWDDFPVTTPARAGGTFETKIHTSRTGERQFRVIHRASKKTTPAITVKIG